MGTKPQQDGTSPGDDQCPRLSFVGVARTPWHASDCPKNMREAKERGQPARLEILPACRAGLTGIERASHLILLGWFAQARRKTLIVHPRHLARPHGVFALRSPDRPNPIAVSIAAVLSIDLTSGSIVVDGLDWFDATPVIDVKPYYASADAVPDAVTVDQRANQHP